MDRAPSNHESEAMMPARTKTRLVKASLKTKPVKARSVSSVKKGSKPTSVKSTSNDGAELSLTVHGNKAVVPCFSIVLYTSELLSRHPTAVLDAYGAFERLCGRARLTMYATETMPKRKPVTPKSLDLLRTWLKPGAPPREYIALDITGGASWAATSDTNFSVFGRERLSATKSGKAIGFG